MTPLGAGSNTRDNLSFTIAAQKNESQKCNPMYVYDGNYTLHTSQFILNKNQNIVPSSIPNMGLFVYSASAESNIRKEGRKEERKAKRKEETKEARKVERKEDKTTIKITANIGENNNKIRNQK